MMISFNIFVIWTRNIFNWEIQKGRSHKKKWETPDIISMKCFFGILLYMGIVKMPSCKGYWSKSILFGNPGFREFMTIDHFEQISIFRVFME